MTMLTRDLRPVTRNINQQPVARGQKQERLISLTFIHKVTIEPFCRYPQPEFSRGNLYGKTETETETKTETKTKT